MQSSNGLYSMLQQEPMVFLLLLVCLSTVYYDYVESNNQYVIIQWPLLDAPSSTHGVFTSFS